MKIQLTESELITLISRIISEGKLPEGFKDFETIEFENYIVEGPGTPISIAQVPTWKSKIDSSFTTYIKIDEPNKRVYIAQYNPDINKLNLITLESGEKGYTVTDVNDPKLRKEFMIGRLKNIKTDGTKIGGFVGVNPIDLLNQIQTATAKIGDALPYDSKRVEYLGNTTNESYRRSRNTLTESDMRRLTRRILK